MALIKCLECGKEISDKAAACIHCGCPIEGSIDQNSMDITTDEKVEVRDNITGTVSEQIIENETKCTHVDKVKKDDVKVEDTPNLFSKWKILFGVSVIIFIIIALVVHYTNENEKQQAMANQAIAYFENREYIEALDTKSDLSTNKFLGEYEEKIELMGRLQNYYKGEDSSYECVLYYLRNYNKFEQLELIDIAYPKVKLAAQAVADKNKNVAEEFEKTLNSEDNIKLEPMLSADKERMLEIMKQIDGDVDYLRAQKRYATYLKEQEEQAQRDYDVKHPIQISNEDYTANLKNGYWYCNGTIHNVSGSTYYYVKVKVTYMDENREVLTTDWTYAVGSEGIKGGENQQFEMMTKVRGSVKYYKVDILEYK